MNITTEQIEQLEKALAQLEELDASELPAPAAELVELLGRILEQTDPS